MPLDPSRTTREESTECSKFHTLPKFREQMRRAQASSKEGRTRLSLHHRGREKTILKNEAEGPWGRRQWLTWEVIMMLESIRKLIAKCRERFYHHFPLPEARATQTASHLTQVAFARNQR